MNNGQSCVNNGGWLTKFYKLEQGLKQGCPCSSLTYLVVAELLALKIKQNVVIKGIYLNKRIQNYKVQYADDTTLFFQDMIDFREILSKIKEFSEFSGLKLNNSKSHIMPISTTTTTLLNTQNVDQVRK